MKIGVIQASSQIQRNETLYECTKKVVESKGYEVINFGILDSDQESYSYIQIAFLISLLIESKTIDFVVTGCSSGQGMAIACNSFPSVLCGYLPTSSDAYLYGRINDGNVASLSLGLGFGWAGEISVQQILNALFEEPFGIGYPVKDAQRKKADTKLLKDINKITKPSIIEVLPKLDKAFVRSSLTLSSVYNYIQDNSKNIELIKLLDEYK